MLRRDPTSITLTVQDVHDYDERRKKQAAQAARAAAGQDAGSSEASPEEAPQPIDPNDELRPLPADRNRRYHSNATPTPGTAAAGNARTRTQDERIGLAR